MDDADADVLRKLNPDDLIELIGVLRRDFRAASVAADAAAKAVGDMADKLSATLAENALLRAVANTARAYMISVDSTDPTITMGDRQRYMAELRRALRVEQDGVS